MADFIFIFCDGHEEHGSKGVNAFTDEAKFIAFVKQSVSDCVDDLPAHIEKAKRLNGGPIFVHTDVGWGGPHIFVVPNGER